MTRLSILLLPLLLSLSPAWAQEESGPDPPPPVESPINVGPRLQPKLAPLPEELFDVKKANNFPLIAPTTNPTTVEVVEDSITPQEPVTEPQPTVPANTAEAFNPSTAEPLVLALTINGMQLKDFTPGLESNGLIYVGLGQLAELLQFPIKVSVSEKRAKGWFIRERNTFDLTEKHVNAGATSVNLEARDIIIQPDDIYIETSQLEKWFALTIAFSRLNMALTVTSIEPLPFEERLRRQREKDRLNAKNGANPYGNYVKVKSPYERFSFPMVDVTLGENYSNQLDDKASSTYNILSKGDLGYLTTEAYISGDLINEPLAQARVNFKREDEDRSLLGFMQASKFQFGDIFSDSQALVSSGTQGVGASVTNRSLYRSDKFDVTTFRGNATPGWDVELYRNGALLDLQTVGTDGLYQFIDIPLYFGRNSFRIVLYGPQGQIEEEHKELFTGSTLLEAGDATYDLSVTDNGHTMLGVSEVGNADTNGPRLQGEIEYGVSKFLTAAMGLARLEQEDGSHGYVTGGLRSSFWGMLASADTAYDVSKAKAAHQLALSTSLFDVDMRARHTWYNGFISDENDDLSRPLKQVTDLDLNTDIAPFHMAPIYASFGIARDEYMDGEIDNLLRLRLSRQLLGMSVTNTLEKNIGDNKDFTGDLAIRGNIARVLFGASLNYHIDPQTMLDQINLSAQFRPTPITTDKVNLTLMRDHSYQLANVLTIKRKKYDLSITGGIDSDQNYFVGLGVNFSFTKLADKNGKDRWYFQSQPMANTGGVLSRAFLDKNDNNQRDEGEEFLEDAEFTRNGAKLVPDKEEKGTTFTTQVAPHSISRIGLNRESLQNPLLVPALEGYEIMPREGHVAVLEFPVYESAQIDGTVSRDPAAADQNVSQINVEILTEDGLSVATAHTEFDGYYVFDNIRPGNYTLRAVTGEGDNETSISRPISLKGSDSLTFDLKLP